MHRESLVFSNVMYYTKSAKKSAKVMYKENRTCTGKEQI